MLPGLMLRLLPEFDAARASLGRVFIKSSVAFVKFAELRRRGLTYRERIEKARHLTELGASAFLACRQKERALRRIDRLILDAEYGDKVVFRDRISNATYEFEKTSVVPALRRFAYVRTLCVTSSADYCVRSVGPSLAKAFIGIYGEKEGARKFRRLKERGFWQRVVDENSSRVAVAMRLNFAAPGTTVISSFSEIPVFVTHDYLASGFRHPREERFFVMWTNSSFAILQLISTTSTTEGSWARMERYTLDRLWIPDFQTFSEEEWAKSERLWERIAQSEATSLLDQVTSGSEFRIALDEGLLELLGFADVVGRRTVGEETRQGVGAAIRALRESMGAGRTDGDVGEEA